VPTYDKKLIRIDAASGRRTGIVAIPDLPESIVFADGSVWLIQFVGGGAEAQSPGAIWRLDAKTLDVRDTRTVPGSDGEASFPIALASGEGALWAVDKFGGSVWRIDTATGDLTPAARGLPFQSIAAAAGFGRIWVGLQQSD
jgi:hypothetical protein